MDDEHYQHNDMGAGDNREVRSTRGRGSHRGRGYRGRGRGGSVLVSARDRTEDASSVDGDEMFEKIVKQYNGKIPYAQFRAMLPRGEDVRRWVEGQGTRFVVFENDSGRISFIGIRVPSAKMCNFYFKQGCTRHNCTYLHLCISHICGHCEYGERCTKSHHYQDDHNRNALAYMNLGDKTYSERGLTIIIGCSSPQICNNYNWNGCNNNDACIRMHVCSEYVMKKRCEKAYCTLDHQFKSAHSVRLLKSFGLDRHLRDGDGQDVIRRSILIDRRKPRDDGQFEGERENTRRGRGGRSRHRNTSSHRGGNRRTYSCSSAGQSGGDDNDENELYAASHSPRVMTTPHSPISSNEPLPAELVVKPKVRLTSGYKEENERKSRSTTRDDDYLELDFKEKLSVRKEDTRPPAAFRERALQAQPLLLSKPLLPPKPRIDHFRNAMQTSLQGFKYDEKKIGYICVDNLTNNCDLGTQCREHHHNKPYLWLIQAFGEWTMLHAVEPIFQNPEKEFVKFKVPTDLPVYGGTVATLHFSTINLKAIAHDATPFEVKRLSTRSSGDRNLGRRGTVWLWFWKGDDGHFQEYDAETMVQLETHLLSGANTVQISRGKWAYTVDFKNMQQINSRTSRVRDMTRRPTKSG